MPLVMVTWVSFHGEGEARTSVTGISRSAGTLKITIGMTLLRSSHCVLCLYYYCIILMFVLYDMLVALVVLCHLKINRK